MLLEKKLENAYNLENALEHSVCKKSEAKCEGVSFPGSITDFIVCAALMLNVFPGYWGTQEFLPGPGQTVWWFRWQRRLPSWFLRSWAEGTSQELGFRWWLGSLSSLDCRVSWACLEKTGALGMPTCPFLAPVEREGNPNLKCLKSAKYENVRASDSSPCCCISYNAFHEVINLKFKPV